MDTKLKYIFTLLLFVSLNAFGQEYNWKSSVLFGGNTTNVKLCSKNDGGKIFVGKFDTALNFQGNDISSQKPSSFFLLSVDNNDSIIWFKKILESEKYNYYGMPVLNVTSIIQHENRIKIAVNFSDSIRVCNNLSNILLENSIGSLKSVIINYKLNGDFHSIEEFTGNSSIAIPYSESLFIDDDILYKVIRADIPIINTDTNLVIINNDSIDIDERVTFLLKEVDNLNHIQLKVEKCGNAFFSKINGSTIVLGDNYGFVKINDQNLSYSTTIENTYFISKVDSNGVVKWSRYFGINGWDSHIQLYDLHISSPNDIVIAGRSFAQSVHNTVYFQNAPTLHGELWNTDDYFVVCYDSLGNVKWQNKSKGPKRERLTSLTSDKDKNIYGLVTFYGPLEFASDTFFSKGSEDILLVCFDSLGNEKWAKQAGGTGLDQGFKIGIDSNENLYVLGGTKSSPVHFGTISYQLSGSNAQFFLAKLDTSSIPNIGIVPQEEPGFFTLYPNPNYGEFLVETKEGLISHIEISNLKGQVIYKDQPQSNKTEISLNYLPTGLFFVKITQSNGKVIVNKFVKK